MRLLILLVMAIFCGAANAEGWGVVLHVTHFKYKASQAIPIMYQVGLKSFREAYYWSILEQTKGVYNPTPPLIELEHAIVQGSGVGQNTPIIMLCCANGLYGGGFPLSTEARAAYLAYVSWVATRLKGRVFEYEVWNEWNIGNSGSSGNRYGDPVEYARLLQDVYATLKNVDPRIRVVGGAIGGWDSAWTEALLQQGAANFMDAISIHPYAYPHPPEIHIDYLNRFQALVRRYRVDLPIYVTEIGWTTYQGTYGMSDWRQGVYLARFMLLIQSVPAINSVYWYDLVDDGPDPAEKEDNFGIQNYDLTPKFSSCMMTEVLNILRNSSFLSAAKLWKNNFGWIWQVKYAATSGGYIFALWTETTSVPLTIQTATGGTVQRICEESSHALGASLSTWVGLQPLVLHTTSASITIQ